DLVKISLDENRTILTQDRDILKRNEVTHGYWVRNKTAEDQLKEVIERFQLKNLINEFTRCLECNTLLNKVDKENVISQLPPKVKEWHNEFYECPGCKKIYWKGSHYERMKLIISDIKN
ncbi:MAG TPA: Mut7-C RNAse domain-containing protein, partial [Ignavibacteriaceae bacterium]